MKKLSEDLKELSKHVANTENKVAAAEKDTKQKVEATIQKSKVDAIARQASFKADVQQKNAAAASQWEELQDNFNQKVQQIKNKRETEKEAREIKKANKRADNAASDAAFAIEFAILAADEAEISVLEAIDAQAYADSLA